MQEFIPKKMRSSPNKRYKIYFQALTYNHTKIETKLSRCTWNTQKKSTIFTPKNKFKNNMVYRFTFVSDEDDAFTRIIDIESDATFLQLHEALQKCTGYKNDQMASFFLCNDEWEKGQEVTLIEMDSSSEFDNLVMEDTKLEELLSDEKQKIYYMFDMLFDRGFYGELSEIITGKSLSEPMCIQSEGKAPRQTMDEADLTQIEKNAHLDSDFYGDSEFELDELDEEGFSDLNFDEQFSDENY